MRAIKLDYVTRWCLLTKKNSYRQETSKWKEWFAWKPIVINGKRYWLQKVFRREILLHIEYVNPETNELIKQVGRVQYEYTTLIDYLSNF
jgi:hypothetical protein